MTVPCSGRSNYDGSKTESKVSKYRSTKFRVRRQDVVVDGSNKEMLLWVVLEGIVSILLYSLEDLLFTSLSL